MNFKLITKFHGIRSSKMRNIIIDKVCTFDCPDFTEHCQYCVHTNNMLLNLGLGLGSLLNSYKNRFTKKELERDVLKYTQLESKKRKVEAELEDNTTEDEDNGKETTDCEATDNEKDNESVKSADLLQELQKKKKMSSSI